MRVAVNALHLVPAETGGQELYARRLIPALLTAKNDLELVIFASREGAPSLRDEEWDPRAEVVEVPVNARSRPRRVLAEQTLLPAGVRRVGAELLHNLFTTAPAIAGVPQVSTIHDVIYKRFPDTHRGVLTHGMAFLTQVSARRSERIIAISQSAKEDIVRFLGVDPAKVDVAHQGPGLAATRPAPEEELRTRFGLDGVRLLLTVSAKRSHKNLHRLIEATARVAADHDIVLLVPGYATHLEDELREYAASVGAADAVRFAGWLDDRTLEGLYRIADCFVFPSLAEGFGLPVLEALAAGTPTASSNATSLPEVGGDAVEYFDPYDVGAIEAAIRRVLDDGALRARLREAGPPQAAKFSWAATAKATIASYERALAAAR